MSSETPKLTEDEKVDLCEERLGYRFNDRSILRSALTHASGASNRLESNERLEFAYCLNQTTTLFTLLLITTNSKSIRVITYSWCKESLIPQLPGFNTREYSIRRSILRWPVQGNRKGFLSIRRLNRLRGSRSKEITLQGLVKGI